MGENLPGSNHDTNSVREDAANDDPSESGVLPSDLKEGAPNAKVEINKKDRHYRKRQSSSSSSDESVSASTSVVCVKKENIDADSDFTGSSSSSSGSASGVTGSGSEEGEITQKKKLIKKMRNKEEIPKKKKKQLHDEKPTVADDGFPLSKDNPAPQVHIKEEKEEASPEKPVQPEEKVTDEIKNENGADNGSETVKIEKPKIDIWAKRTVDQAFHDALQRYYERKAARAALRRA